jgi:hypothetical protein
MENLYLYGITVYGLENQGASGFQSFKQKDVSSSPGCIHWVLRSTLRYGASLLRAIEAKQ